MNTEEEDKIAHAILDRTITLRRLSANEQRKVLVILQKMEEDLIYSLLHDDLTAFGRRDKARLLSQAQSIIEDYYSRAGDEMAQTLTGLSRAEAEFITSTLGDTLIDMNFGLPTEGYFKSVMSDVLIQGAPSADWWKRQAGDVSFRFANEIRQGLIQGDSNPQIIKRVQDMMGIPRNNAAALVQTSVQTIANDSRRKTFEKNSDVVQGIQQISTLDSHTSLTCIAYSGARWTIEDYEPIAPSTLPYDGGVPRHFNCRSVEVPIFKNKDGTWSEHGGTRASDIGQIDAKTTMAEFIKMKGLGFADRLLGVGRAQLFLDGKISLTQLLDQSGRPISLKQLNEMYQ